MRAEIITDLVHISTNNINGIEWELPVMLYTDETRKNIACGVIGYITVNGFESCDTKDGYEYLAYCFGVRWIFVRRKKK